MRQRKPDATSSQMMGALPQCWHSRGENFCQLKFVQLRPTGFWCPCIMATFTQTTSSKATRTSKRQPSLRSASCALAEMWFPGCVAGNPCSPNQHKKEMFAVNNAPTPEHCSERLPTCPQCLCVACNQFSWNCDGLPESRSHLHEGIKNWWGLPHQWNIHTRPPLAAQPCWRVSSLRN